MLGRFSLVSEKGFLMYQNGHARARETVGELVEKLQILAHVTVEHVEAEPFNGQADAAIELDVAGKKVVLLVEVKPAAYPRDVRETMWRLLAVKRDLEAKGIQNIVPFVAASSISVGARQLLREENVGFFDHGGSLFVPARGAYLDVERPVPKSGAKVIGSLFTGKRSQILHILLLNRDTWFGATDLAKDAKVSFGTASETLLSLERLEWVSTRGKGPNKERRLSDARALLDGWTDHVTTGRRLKRRRFYIPGSNPDSIAHRLHAECAAIRVDYVITQDWAAQQYSPHLSSINRIACRMPPGDKTDNVLERLNARTVTEGANLDLIETSSQSEYLFAEKHADLWLASPVQVYLDLLQGDGRSKDMADFLRKEILGL